MKRTFTLFLLCVCSYVAACAQERFSRQQLSDDLDSLYSTVYQCHPDLFYLLSQEEFEAEIEKARARLTDSMSVYDLFRIAGPLLTKLGDGHTSVHPPADQYGFENIRAVPLHFEFDPYDTVMYVLNDLTGTDQIPAGARIVTINGRSPQRIVEELLPYRSGESPIYRIKSLGIFTAVYMSMIFDDCGPYTVTYRLDGQTNTVGYEGLLLKDFLVAMGGLEQKVTEPYTLEIDEKKNVAIIYFNQCEFGPDGALDRFLDSTFTLIRDRDIRDLIVDIRKNGGGHSGVGDALFQYFSPGPFKQFGNTLIKYGEPMLRQAGITDIEPGSTRLSESTEKDLHQLKDNPLRFSGHTYLLTSPSTFSSASSFAAGFKAYNMGTIIGEETGGWMVSFGDQLAFMTPNARLPYGVSFKKFYLAGAVDANRHGVLPDVPVPASQAMEKAYELIVNR